MKTSSAYQWNVGMYLRLSREDGDKAESDSIRNQRELIRDYLSRNPNMRLFKEYADDGFSGTNFNRPSFVSMVSDAKKRKINCIIVKDLSRLGRNYIETGRYIEEIFPSMGLRLIALNDHYDSFDRNADETHIIIPIKNLINDAYCRDISIKIRSNLDVKRKSGQYIGSFALYGYRKDPENKNHLLIDEYAAEIVEKIFSWKISGCGQAEIAERLNALGVQPPYQYKRKCGFNFNAGFKSADGAKWCVESVNRILKNEMYTGKMIQGKVRKVNYKVAKNLPTDESEWFCVDGTHEAIIPRERFETVRTLLQKDTRTSPEHETVYPLSGYVKCGDCHQNMVRRVVTRAGKRYAYFHCSTYKRGGDCTSHLINCEKVEIAVLTAIQHQVALMDKVEVMFGMLDENPQEAVAIRSIDRQLEKFKQDIEYYGSLKAKLYKDMVDGIVSKAEYEDLRGRFDRSRSDVEKTFNKLAEKKKQLLNGQLHLQPWIENLKRYKNFTELARQTVVALIEEVVIYDAHNICVVFLFQDEMEEMMKYLEIPTGVEVGKEGVQ